MTNTEGKWIDECIVSYSPLDSNARQKTHPIPITLYETDTRYHQGKLIAVNKTYMVYSVRSGCLRVINKFTAKRGLLKGHTQHQLMDVAFQCFESNLIASTNADGSLIIWEIMETGENVGKTKLMHLMRKEDEIGFFKRLRWHPSDPNIVFTMSDKSQIDVWNIQLLQQNVEYYIDDVPENAHCCIRPAMAVEIHDLGLSYDCKILASGGSEANKVALWKVPDGCIGQYQLIVEFIPHGGDVVHSLHFLGSPQAPDLVHFLITGGVFNQEFKMWSLQDIHQGSLRLLQTIKFVPNPALQLPQSESDNQPFLNVAQVDPTSSFLVLCNQKEPVAWVLHIKNPYMNDDGDLDTRMDYITEFDVQNPVISFGLTNRVPKASPSGTDAPKVDSGPGVGLICIQPKSIQLWQLDGLFPDHHDLATNGDTHEVQVAKGSKDGDTQETSAGESLHENKQQGSAASEQSAKDRRRLEMLKLLNSLDDKVSSPAAGSENLSTAEKPSALDTTPVESSASAWVQCTPTSAPDSATSTQIAKPTSPGPAGEVEQPLPITEKSAAFPPQPTEILPTMPPIPDLTLSPEISKDPVAMLERCMQHMHDMQRFHAFEWGRMQALMKQQQEEHRRQMEEMKACMYSQVQKTDESSFHVSKEQRQALLTFQTQLQTATTKQFQDMNRLLSDKLKEHSELLRPQVMTMAANMESRQKQFAEEILRDIKKEMAQFKDQLQVYIKHQKEFNDMAKMRTKDAMEAEQQRMQKLLEAVSHTILNSIPDTLEQKFEAKVEASFQKKLMPAIVSSVETKLEKTLKEGMKSNFQKTLLPQIEASFQKIFDQVNATLRTSLQSQSDEVGRTLRPEGASLAINRNFEDQENAVVQMVTEHLTKTLPGIIERLLENQLAQALPKLIQQTMTDMLRKLAAGGGLGQEATPSPEASPQEIFKDEAPALIQAKEYDKVFTKALGLSSIEIMEWLCSQVEPKEVFEGPHALTNAVILSLIHQLAFDLSSQTQLKLAWLQECVVSLDPEDTVVKPHLSDVLGQVINMMERFLTDACEADQKKGVKAMIMMMKSVVVRS